ncbi:MAG: ATP-binding protein [Actinobacteria bacterium]|nr:ATP-binding protein [Actinomycetota bacterium]
MVESGHHIEKKLDVQSHTKNLSLIRNEIEDAASACGFDDAEIYQMKVAVSEAAANAIEHGSPLGEKNRVHLTIECNPDRISIEVVDEGVFKARLPVTDGRPSHRGRGIFIMTALMDEVSITEGQEGTSVRLVKLKDKRSFREREQSSA